MSVLALVLMLVLALVLTLVLTLVLALVDCADCDCASESKRPTGFDFSAFCCDVPFFSHRCYRNGSAGGVRLSPLLEGGGGRLTLAVVKDSLFVH